MAGQEQMGCCPILNEGASRVKPEATTTNDRNSGLAVQAVTGPVLNAQRQEKE